MNDLIKILKERVGVLVRDDRSLKEKLPIAILANLALAFTLIVFGPYELYSANLTYLKDSFLFSDFWWMMALIGIIYVVVVTAVCVILKGKLFDYTVTFIFGLTLCGYIQCNFLNGRMESLDGNYVAWNNMATKTLMGLGEWFAIMIAVFFVLFLSRKAWSVLVKFGSFLLLGMQGVALVFLLFTMDFSGGSDKYLSTDSMFKLSDNNNVIVFVLDRFDSKVADMILEEDSEYFSQLNGFTYYTDATSKYSFTFPSVPYMLTQKEYFLEKFYAEYLEEAYADSEFLKELKNTNVTIEAYTDVSLIGDSAAPLINNLTFGKKEISYAGIFKGMMKLSMYRYSPNALKPTFWMYTGDLQDMALEKGENGPYKMSDSKFFERLSMQGIETQSESSSFKFYHLRGAHPPYVMDEHGNNQSGGTTQIQQSRGSFTIIFNYLTQMQELGIYDDATIIITADHGYDDEPNADGSMGSPSKPILFVKEQGVSAEESLAISNAQASQDDLFALIANSLGGDGSKFGASIADISETENKKRTFYYIKQVDGAVYSYLEYEANGDGNKKENWKFTGKEYLNKGTYY